MSLKRTSENMMRISIKICVYTLLVICMVFLATKGYMFGQAIFSNDGYETTPGTDVVVTISGKESKMEVAAMLTEKGVVEDKIVFYIQSLLYEAKYIPGEYTLNSSLSGEDIVEILSTPVETGQTEGN